MSGETKPTPITARLRALIEEGVEFSQRPNFPGDAGKLWVMQVRTMLKNIYAENAPEIDFWCSDHKLDSPQMTSQARITSRLPQLERLATVLTIPHGAAKIFIGHGRSPEWLKLRIFFSETLGLPCDEFNIEPTAGLQTANRIETMLASARMALLVMTGEDQHSDGTTHARENVIHEIGLFQAKLGQRRAIVMLENGCARFSNLDGLTTINFPKGDIMARSEEIRGVLAREWLL